VTEARAVNMIRHPNIIDIYHFGCLDNGQHYHVMELLEGQSLRELLANRGHLGLGEAFPILRGLADALDAAHAVGIAHRDLKPDNVFVVLAAGQAARAKLVDFGVAKLLGGEKVAHRTAPGAAIGTPMYMAPEQWRSKEVDQRADIYSFGAVVHEVLTGFRPFAGDSLQSLLIGHLQSPAPAMSSVAPQLPATLDAPVQRMLAKDPQSRPQAAGEALDELVAAAHEAGIACGDDQLGAQPAPTPPQQQARSTVDPAITRDRDPGQAARTGRQTGGAVEWARRLTGSDDDDDDDGGGR